MTTPQAKHILHYLRRIAARMEEFSDRKLLRRYVDQHDEEAFARLTRRHRPLVQGVALRVLSNWHDSEDVAQAAFLVLARKAASLRWHESVACWLYRVAYHLALKARAASARRQAKERQAATRATPDACDDIRLSEARALLDEELAALPERYRAPILLCCLEAATQEEAARQLGCSLATLKRRLAKGRELLRMRLARRGLTLSAALMPALLAPDQATAAAMTLSNPSAQALLLAEAALRAMTMTKVKIAVVVLLALSTAAVGGGWWMRSERSEGQSEQARPALAARTVEERPSHKDQYGDDLPPSALARFGTVRFRQGNIVYALDLSPDGRKLITVGGNSRLHLWDVATGKEIRRFPEEKPLQTTSTHAAVFAPDGQTFATGGFFGLSLWQTSTGKRIHYIEWGPVYSLAFAPDGKTLVAGTLNKGPSLWDVASGKMIAQLEEQGAKPGPSRAGLRSLAFASDGTMLASVYGNNIILWDIAMRKEIRRMQGHGKNVHTVVFAPKGKMLASGGEDRTIHLWDAASVRELRQLKGHEATVTSLLFSADGKTLISSSGDSYIFDPRAKERRALRLWDVASGQERGAIGEFHDGALALALSKDGKRLISSDGGCVRLWNPATGQEIRPLGGHRQWISGVAFSPDGKRVATAGGDCTVRLWDAATGRLLRVFASGDEPADSVAFSPDGRTLASTGRDGILRLWDPSSGREIRQLRAHQARQTYVAFSPDGKYLATASRDETAALWDAATGRELRRFKGGEEGFLCLAFSPDGKRIAAGEIFDKPQRMIGKGPDAAGPLIRVWDAATGKQIHALQGHKNIMIHGVVFSPDGKVLASTGWDKTTRLWDAATGRELGQIPAGEESIALSPDGRMLATGGFNGMVRLWEVATRKERVHFAGHEAAIEGLAFAPDGRTLVSGSMDTTALLWDVRGRQRSARPFDAEKCWQGLADADAAKAYQAMTELAAVPQQAARLLRQRVQAVRPPRPERLARLLADLDSDHFEVREKAMKQIESIGELAKLTLEKTLAGKPSLEARRRIEQLLVNVESANSPEQLRALRAVEVLEYIGTPQARRLLETLAEGAAEARLTGEAKASLTRLGR